MDDDDIELKVCPKCDAPLPNDKRKVTFFNEDLDICDDCIDLKQGNKGGYTQPLYIFISIKLKLR